MRNKCFQKISTKPPFFSEIYFACSVWLQAMETAEMYDRIHLRTTYYSYAKHLEGNGEMTEAIPK